jgi:peptide/nickel transport system substrate-binding protein
MIHTRSSRLAFCPALVLSALMVLFAGCGKPSQTEPEIASGPVDMTPVDGDTVVRRLQAEPKTLNPITARDMYERVVNEYIYDSLITRSKETLENVPWLAESYTISDDHLEYTFNLRKDIKFHDGTPMTARDVAFSYERIQDPTVDAAHMRNYYRDVKSMEVIDDYTVKFTYAKPYWLALEFVGGFPVLPKHVFGEGDFNKHPNGRHPVGTGPYKFVKWETGREIVLERNEHYWGDRPRLDRMVFKIVTDDTVAMQLFKRGEIDVYRRMPAEQWVRQTKGAEFEKRAYKLAYDELGYGYIGWNMRRPFFSDKMMRRAMTHLIDRQTILDTLRYGLGTIVTGNFYLNGPAYDHSIKPWPYDPEEAKRLMDEAGWTDHDNDGLRDKDGVPFKFEFLIPSSSKISEQLATIMQEDLKKIGIEMGIRKLEWATFEQQVQDRKFDATTMAWSMEIEGDPYQLWHSSQAEKGSNYVGFVNDEADKIIDDGRAEFDDEKRRAMYKRLHAILHEEQPYTFNYCPQQLTVVDKRFENVKAYNARMALEPTEWWVPKARQKYGRDN